VTGRLKGAAVAGLLLTLMLVGSGCNYDLNKLFSKANQPQKVQLIKAEIHFADKEVVTCYIQSLGMAEDAEIYVGGNSINYMYDKNGKIIGSYNYQRVDYIKMLRE